MGEIEKSCCEVSFILEHLAIEDKVKIPQSVFQFFKKNSDDSYKVSLNPSEPLLEQELKEETKAFLQILYHNYFDKEMKPQNEDDFQSQTLSKSSQVEENQEKTVEITIAKEKLVTYQESKLKRFLNKLLSILKK